MVARAPLSLTRRGLLALGAGGAVAGLVGCDESDRAAEPPKGAKRIRYGDEHPAQHGDLRVPDGTVRGLVVLVHGGYWLAEYGASLMDDLADDLLERGWASWNIEYRRIGDGGGFPATFDDVAAAFDTIPSLEVAGPVVSVGHSAGGHLAAWAASRTPKTPGGAPKATPELTISLSGVLDLSSAAIEYLGGGAAIELMNGAPKRHGADYALTDPCELVPAQGKVVAVHAEDDDIVPLDQSTTYVQLDVSAGGDAELVTVPGDHFALIDPGSDAWAKTLTLLP